MVSGCIILGVYVSGEHGHKYGPRGGGTSNHQPYDNCGGCWNGGKAACIFILIELFDEEVEDGGISIGGGGGIGCGNEVLLWLLPPDNEGGGIFNGNGGAGTFGGNSWDILSLVLLFLASVAFNDNNDIEYEWSILMINNNNDDEYE